MNIRLFILKCIQTLHDTLIYVMLWGIIGTQFVQHGDKIIHKITIEWINKLYWQQVIKQINLFVNISIIISLCTQQVFHFIKQS